MIKIHQHLYDPQTRRRFKVKCNCASTKDRTTTVRFVNNNPQRYILLTKAQFDDTHFNPETL